MSAAVSTAPEAASSVIRARRPGFFADLATVAGRAIRGLPRDMEFILPALIIPVFFFVVNTGSLQSITEGASPGFDYKAFQLPMSVIFGITGVSRATVLVLDIQGGYFDRLLMTPVSRAALLLGLMVADVLTVIGLAIPVLIMGFAVGVRFDAGVLGMIVFLLICAGWALAFAGFPYAIALKTGNPAAVNTSFLIFLPFAFLTTAFVPAEALTGWFATLAKFNPVTYLLEALRSLVTSGWDTTALLQGVLAVSAVGAVSMTLAFLAMKGRIKRG